MSTLARGIEDFGVPRIIFRDFDEFADAINGVAGRFVPTARSEADWWVQHAPIGRLTIQQLQTGGATAFVGDGKDNAFTIGIPTTAPAHIHVDGSSLAENSFIFVNEGQPFAVSARRAVRWAGITVPVGHPCLSPEIVKTLNVRVRGGNRQTHTQSDARLVVTAKVLVSRVFENDNSVAFFEAAAAQAAEDEILAIASHVLEASNRAEYRRLGRPPLPRARVIARALDLIGASAGQPLLIRDLSRATGSANAACALSSMSISASGRCGCSE